MTHVQARRTSDMLTFVRSQIARVGGTGLGRCRLSTKRLLMLLYRSLRNPDPPRTSLLVRGGDTSRFRRRLGRGAGTIVTAMNRLPTSNAALSSDLLLWSILCLFCGASGSVGFFSLATFLPFGTRTFGFFARDSGLGAPGCELTVVV